MNIAPLMPDDPRSVGPYEVMGRLGEGGQGVVYLGRLDGQVCAIKLLHARFSGDDVARERFLREVAVTKRVARFCTAQVLDTNMEGERPYIVSEYVPGRSLRELIDSEGPRGGAALERLAINTATALAAIHQAGIVHRDFKPANVLIGPEGPVVIDFGIARALDASAATATLTGHVIGTPAFMAPEQRAGADPGPAADMFAWAVTMTFAASGRLPGRGPLPGGAPDGGTLPGGALGGGPSGGAVGRGTQGGAPALGGAASGGTSPVPSGKAFPGAAPTGSLGALVTACMAADPALRPTARQVVDRLLGAETDVFTQPSPTLVTDPGHGPDRAPIPSRSSNRSVNRGSSRSRRIVAIAAVSVVALGLVGAVAAFVGPFAGHGTARGAARRPIAAPRTSAAKPPVRPTAPRPTHPTRSPARPAPAARPDPYSPTGLCGQGYRVIDSHGLPGGAVYLLYSASNGDNCVVTLATRSTGKVPMNAILRVKSGAQGANPGRYDFYAGPVRLPARSTCVAWGGMIGGSPVWLSGWVHCG